MRLVRLCSVAILATAVSAPNFADDHDTGEDFALEEVTVTAERQETVHFRGTHFRYHVRLRNARAIPNHQSQGHRGPGARIAVRLG